MTFNAEDINRRQKDFYKFNTYALVVGAQNVSNEAAVLARAIVNTSSSGTLKIFDSSGTSTAQPILSLSVAAKDQIILDVLCTSGIYCVPTSCSPTLFYKKE